MLDVKELSVGYQKRPILQNISFTVQSGEVACILGQNGCGKTTLLKTISHILPPIAGDVLVDGTNLAGKTRKEIAQKLTLMGGLESGYFSYTVFQTVLLARYVWAEKSFLGENFSPTDMSCVENILEKLDIAPLKNRLLTELSSGQLQKVFFARALAQDTPLLLLDEPTSHLDLKAQIEICNDLRIMASEQKLSVLAVVHDINLALNFADRIILLKDGTLFENAPLADLNLEKLNRVYEIDVAAFMKKSLQFWK